MAIANPQLRKLDEQLKAARSQQRNLVDSAEAADRDFTDDEKAAFDGAEQEVRSLESRIDRLNKTLDANAKAAGEGNLEPDLWPGQSPRITNPKPAFEDDPKRGFKSTHEFFRAVLSHSMSSPGPIHPRAVKDERLKFLATAGSDEAGTYSDPYGGFLVPSGFLPSLLQLAAEGDPTAGRTQQIPMATPKVCIPARTDKTHTTSVTGGLVVYRRAETQTVTASRMEVEQVELSAVPLMGLSYATEELISDSAISFVALLEAGFRDEFASKILNEKINGTGAGQFEGVLNSPAVVGVTKETGQDADSIVYENIVNMRSRCWGYQNAVWLYNHDCLPQLMQLVMVIGTSGVPMWQTSAREGEPDMLLGRPAFATEYCPTVGDKGDVILGNWSQYLEGTYKPLESAESLHVRFEYNERTFRFLMRNDGKCWWRAALTPKKSATTLSPFVVINARA